MQRRAGMAAALCMETGFVRGTRAHAHETERRGSTHGAEWTAMADEGVELINETRRDPLGAFLFGAGLFGLARARRLAGGCAVPCVPCRDGSARDAGRYAGTDLMTTQPGLVICRRAGGQPGRQGVGRWWWRRRRAGRQDSSRPLGQQPTARSQQAAANAPESQCRVLTYLDTYIVRTYLHAHARPHAHTHTHGPSCGRWPRLCGIVARLSPPHPPTPITSCLGGAVGPGRRLAALVDDPSVPPLRPLHQLYPPLHPPNGCRAVDATFPRKKRGRGHNAGSIFPRYRENRVSGPSVRFSLPLPRRPGGQINAGSRGVCTSGQWQGPDRGGGAPSTLAGPPAQGANSRPLLQVQACKPASLPVCCC